MTVKKHPEPAAATKLFQCEHPYGPTVLIVAADPDEARRLYLEQMNVISSQWPVKVEELTEQGEVPRPSWAQRRRHGPGGGPARLPGVVASLAGPRPATEGDRLGEGRGLLFYRPATPAGRSNSGRLSLLPPLPLPA